MEHIYIYIFKEKVSAKRSSNRQVLWVNVGLNSADVLDSV